MRRRTWAGALAFGAIGFAALMSCSSEESGSDWQPPHAKGGSGGSPVSDGAAASADQSVPPSDGSMMVDVVTSVDGSQFDPDAYWANDPPPQQCLDSGLTVPTPGGTPECPDDKNREGCACATTGEKAACWPGFRKNRNRGICHDGTTTCLQKGENQREWGPCEGYQLPTGTTGKEACLCFSSGQWKLQNLSPCFVDGGGGPGSAGAVSTIWNGTQPQCPAISGTDIVKPSQPWSKDWLKIDCAGHFKLCYTLKAGDAKNPQASDCTLTKVCVETDYPKADVEQELPDLPSWLATTAAEKTCAVQFASTGGYGEMSVIGLSVECDVVDDGSGGEQVFNRVQYCPLYCNENPNAPECQNCQSGGSGQF